MLGSSQLANKIAYFVRIFKLSCLSNQEIVYKLAFQNATYVLLGVLVEKVVTKVVAS